MEMFFERLSQTLRSEQERHLLGRIQECGQRTVIVLAIRDFEHVAESLMSRGPTQFNSILSCVWIEHAVPFDTFQRLLSPVVEID